MTEPWSPDTAQGPSPVSWRDPAAWQEDPATAAQAAVAELSSTAQATVAELTSKAQPTVADLTTKAQSLLADFEVRTADRPEIRIGAAFAGGLMFALILRRLAR